MKELNIKLICSDIDGTLLDKNRELSSKTIAVFSAIKDNYPCVLISSRMPKSLRQLQKNWTFKKTPLLLIMGV